MQTEDGVVTFVVSTTAPPISDQYGLRLTDQELAGDSDYWLLLVEAAMNRWNNVNGTKIKLQATQSDQATLDSTDGVHSIVVGETNLSSSAYAKPEITDKVITDCDIAVSSRGSSAGSLAYTLMHELGHCLGLGHNHADYRAVMGYSRTDRSLVLGLDDEAGALYLYPDSEAATPQELIRCGQVGGMSPTWSGFAWVYYAAPVVLHVFNSLWRRRKFRMEGALRA